MTKLALTVTALFSLFAFTAQAGYEPLSSYYLPGSDPARLRAISRLFEIEHKRGTGYEVQVPQSQAPLLLSLAPDAELLEADVSAAIRRQLQAYRLTSAASYHSFAQVQDWMKALAAAHPDLVQLKQYGSSGEGRPLMALRLTTEAGATKPVVMITAATHGDELVTTEVLMHLVDRLLGAYHKEDRLTKIVDRLDLYFVPVLNPDGFTATRRYDGNADPNRSYPYPENLRAKPTPSIAGIIQLFESLDVKASIDFHAYGEMIMYPWAYTYDSIEPVARGRLDALTTRMAETNRYAHGPISEVIYIAPGSSADYYFWKKGALSLGIEIGNSKVPSPSSFPEYFESQEESTWRFLEGI